MKFKVNPPVKIRPSLNLPEKVYELEFEMLARPAFREYEYIERISKQKYDDWSALMNTKVLFFLSILHGATGLITWDQIADLSPADFEVTEPDPEDEDQAGELDQVDPTGGAVAPG